MIVEDGEVVVGDEEEEEELDVGEEDLTCSISEYLADEEE